MSLCHCYSLLVTLPICTAGTATATVEIERGAVNAVNSHVPQYPRALISSVEIIEGPTHMAPVSSEQVHFGYLQRTVD